MVEALEAKGCRYGKDGQPQRRGFKGVKLSEYGNQLSKIQINPDDRQEEDDKKRQAHNEQYNGGNRFELEETQ